MDESLKDAVASSLKGEALEDKEKAMTGKSHQTEPARIKREMKPLRAALIKAASLGAEEVRPETITVLDEDQSGLLIARTAERRT